MEKPSRKMLGVTVDDQLIKKQLVAKLDLFDRADQRLAKLNKFSSTYQSVQVLPLGDKANSRSRDE